MLAGFDRRAHVIGMADKDKAKEERLATALRENLKRRKEQARASKERKPQNAPD